MDLTAISRENSEANRPLEIGVPGSILYRLNDDRVFSVAVKAGGVNLRESCDGFYGCNLTKAELLQLIAELRQIADAM